MIQTFVIYELHFFAQLYKKRMHNKHIAYSQKINNNLKRYYFLSKIKKKNSLKQTFLNLNFEKEKTYLRIYYFLIYKYLLYFTM